MVDSRKTVVDVLLGGGVTPEVNSSRRSNSNKIRTETTIQTTSTFIGPNMSKNIVILRKCILKNICLKIFILKIFSEEYLIKIFDILEAGPDAHGCDSVVDEGSLTSVD